MALFGSNRNLKSSFSAILGDTYMSPLHPLNTGYPITGTLTKSEGPDKMQHNAAFHQVLHCLL